MTTTPHTTMLFGSFDGIHPGHEYLISQAQDLGGKVIAVIAQDNIILRTKKKSPRESLEQRMENMQKTFPDITVIAGDTMQGAWSAIKTHRPATIVVGYDQDALKAALIDIQNTYDFNIIQISSFHPEKYKSSILRKINL